MSSRTAVPLEDACLAIVDCEHKTAPVDPAGDHFAVGTPAMVGNRIDFTAARRISRETFDNWTRRLRPRFDDLLLAREAPVGPIVCIPESENVAPGQRTVLLRSNPNVADPRYLYYLLSSPRQQEALKLKAAGSTVSHLNVADVRTFPVELPCLSEQRAVAALLGALDDKIAADGQLAAVARELTAVEFAAIEEISSTVCPLGAVLRLEYGRALPAPQRVPGAVSVVGSGGVVGTHDTSWLDGPGVVVGRKGSVGATYWQSDRFFPIDTTYYVVPQRSAITMMYCYHLLKNTDLASLNSDSAVPGLNRTEAYATPVRVPADDLIGRVSERGMHLFSLADRHDAESAALATLRDTLLPELISGRLRVKDAEKQVEDVL